MNRQDKSSTTCKIDRKWVREEKRTFSIFPGLPRAFIPGEEENWLELMQFYRDDLKWLLSLDHHKFWSQMIYSDKPHELLISFLKGSPQCHIKTNILVEENMRNIYADVEHLVFLIFLRLSTEKESENCFIRNFGETIYNNYLFTVPIILDLCLIYGTSNPDLVKKMINNVITSAPDFLDDIQEIIPHFVNVLKTVTKKFSNSLLDDATELPVTETQDLVLYLCDSVATIQVFFEMYPNVCQLFNKSEIINEIVFFYSNKLPQIVNHVKKYKDSVVLISLENIRIDMLRIVKSILDFVSNESNDILEKRTEKINEYLELMMELLSEPVFLFDYNLLYSVEFEIECAMRNCDSVDSTKVNCILKGVEKVVRKDDDCTLNNGVDIRLLVTEVRDIFPNLDESFIKECLSYYNNDTEKVISAVLENMIPPSLSENTKSEDEFKGKHKHKHKNLNEMLNDKEEINKIKESYSLLSYVADDIYDDEYDDSCDNNAEVSVQDGDEVVARRPFVTPRVLRTREEEGDCDDGGDEEVEEDELEEMVARERFNFVENPEIVRERIERGRGDRNFRDVVGRGRGHGQSKQVLRNREYKESHKSFVSNHNRKKQAGKKYSRGMVPF